MALCRVQEFSSQQPCQVTHNLQLQGLCRPPLASGAPLHTHVNSHSMPCSHCPASIQCTGSDFSLSLSRPTVWQGSAGDSGMGFKPTLLCCLLLPWPDLPSSLLSSCAPPLPCSSEAQPVPFLSKHLFSYTLLPPLLRDIPSHSGHSLNHYEK